MEETLRRFGEQFEWEPEIVNKDTLKTYARYVVCGMGGSHLGAWLLKRYGNASNVVIHRDYGLPELPDWDDTLVILSSYSGSTEEVLDSADVALSRGLPMAAISTGGPLLAFAKEHGIPYVEIPDLGLEPRMAIGFSMLGILRFMNLSAVEATVRMAGKAADPFASKGEGERLATLLHGKTPIIYASAQNTVLAYRWKINFNETSKIPAFANVFPELNHNELSGFDILESTQNLSSKMVFLFLRDPSDHPRIIRRMDVAEEMLIERGMVVERIELKGDEFSKAFASAFLSDWTSFSLGAAYGAPSVETPLIAEFKKRILE